MSTKGDVIRDTRPHLLLAGRWKEIIEPSITTSGIVGGSVTVRSGDFIDVFGTKERNKYHRAETAYFDPDYTTIQALYQSKETVITDITYTPMTCTWDLNLGGAVRSVSGFPLEAFYDEREKSWESNREENEAWGIKPPKRELSEIPQRFRDYHDGRYGVEGPVYEIYVTAATAYTQTVKTIFTSSIKANWTKTETTSGFRFGMVGGWFDKNGSLVDGVTRENGEFVSVNMRWLTETSMEKRYYEPIDDVDFVSATKTA